MPRPWDHHQFSCAPCRCCRWALGPGPSKRATRIGTPRVDVPFLRQRLRRGRSSGRVGGGRGGDGVMGASCAQAADEAASRQEKSDPRTESVDYGQNCVWLAVLLLREKEMDLIDGGGEAGELARWALIGSVKSFNFEAVFLFCLTTFFSLTTFSRMSNQFELDHPLGFIFQAQKLCWKWRM